MPGPNDNQTQSNQSATAKPKSIAQLMDETTKRVLQFEDDTSEKSKFLDDLLGKDFNNRLFKNQKFIDEYEATRDNLVTEAYDLKKEAAKIKAMHPKDESQKKEYEKSLSEYNKRLDEHDKSVIALNNKRDVYDKTLPKHNRKKSIFLNKIVLAFIAKHKKIDSTLFAQTPENQKLWLETAEEVENLPYTKDYLTTAQNIFQNIQEQISCYPSYTAFIADERNEPLIGATLCAYQTLKYLSSFRNKRKEKHKDEKTLDQIDKILSEDVQNLCLNLTRTAEDLHRTTLNLHAQAIQDKETKEIFYIDDMPDVSKQRQQRKAEKDFLAAISQRSAWQTVAELEGSQQLNALFSGETLAKAVEESLFQIKESDGLIFGSSKYKDVKDNLSDLLKVFNQMSEMTNEQKDTMYQSVQSQVNRLYDAVCTYIEYKNDPDNMSNTDWEDNRIQAVKTLQGPISILKRAVNQQIKNRQVENNLKDNISNSDLKELLDKNRSMNPTLLNQAIKLSLKRSGNLPEDFSQQVTVDAKDLSSILNVIKNEQSEWSKDNRGTQQEFEQYMIQFLKNEIRPEGEQRNFQSDKKYTFQTVTEQEYNENFGKKQSGHYDENLEKNTGSFAKAINEGVYQQRKESEKNPFDHIKEIRVSNDKVKKELDLHYDHGAMYAAQGINSIRIDCSGSGFDHWRSDYNSKYLKGNNATIDHMFARAWKSTKHFVQNLFRKKKKLSPGEIRRQEIEKKFGKGGVEEVNAKHETKTHVRSKTEVINGTEKTRINIAGSHYLGGAKNAGDYSIEKVRDYTVYIGQKYIKEYIEKNVLRNKLNGKDPKDFQLPVILNGHSRGAVAVSQATKLLQEWVQKEYPEYAKNVKFESIFLDSVAGKDANKGANREITLPDTDTMNTTAMYSLFSNHSGKLFAPQTIKNASRVIITPFEHSSGLKGADKTQTDKQHVRAYQYAEDGKMYRNTGLSDLPEGVFMVDENNVIHRLKDQNELIKACDMISEKMKNKFEERRNVILEASKSCFARLRRHNKIVYSTDSLESRHGKSFDSLTSESKEIKESLKTSDTKKAKTSDSLQSKKRPQINSL